MCGIAGFAGAPIGGREAERIASSMARCLAHRGPDAQGVRAEEDGAVAFGHRRLAIVDLSEAGLQPMASADGRWLICYNGEIYNHSMLRAQLLAAGLVFRGHSDTEVILEWIARRGLSDLLNCAEGMFAFALWDRRERRLHLVRDPMGVKPLYWNFQTGRLAFASELKAFRELPGFAPEVDPDAVALLMRFGNVPSPRSILRGVRKLPPGAALSWSPGQEPSVQSYWSVEKAARAAATTPLEEKGAALVDRIEAELVRSVSQEMVADVPIGCFLSGGVDSTLVTALMRRLAGGPIHTFNVAFEEAGYDESPHAAAIAAHLGVVHHQVKLGPAEAATIIHRLPAMFDEPISDMAQLPTYLVSHLARKTVTVALSGDGGDELFGGYDRYAQAALMADRLLRLPRAARAPAAELIDATPSTVLNGIAALLSPGLAPGRGATRASRLSQALRARSRLDVYRSLVELWPESRSPALAQPALPEAWLALPIAQRDPELAFQIADCRTLLPDTLLAKMDRASMAASLEVRVPLLNHRLAELAFRLGPESKRRGRTGKWILRHILDRYVPNELVNRPKQGFGVPMAHWLRGPLRDWAEDLLAPASLATSGLVRPEPVRQAWADHLSKRVDASHPLWAVLVLMDWRKSWSAATVAPPYAPAGAEKVGAP
ncbi:asparagine synthase (glutamine-hydrolyzing) [Alsobacter soli]|uniref:asparagine synthase (glutamine-hydrolyzing) n=1 Tax=Alsobacter soli TaxID=2109933 RepID=A0A2T1HQ27_9HYPH|nr:asparagine synthase (glutamine-hydrolyzing) [Alsobacter soli]PSC03727.1 asparagine synthase (glutamine-hydrolyzing) [Alsobacter soli]